MLYRINKIQTYNIQWARLPGEVAIDVVYSKKEWAELRQSILEVSQYPFKTQGELVGLLFYMNEGLTKALLWVGTPLTINQGMMVDVHEPPLIAQLGSRVPMQSGDVGFYTAHKQWVLIERKSWTDLLAGLGEFGKTKTQSPRDVNKQMTQLIDNSDISIFILEGSDNVKFKDSLILYNGARIPKIKTPPWHKNPKSYVWGWLIPWIIAGVLVIQTDDIDDTVKFVTWLYDFMQKEEHDTVYRSPRPIIIQNGTTSGLNLLLGIDGYGEKLARAAMGHFGTARKFFDATWDERSEVPGIGGLLAIKPDAAMSEIYVPGKSVKI